MLGDGSIGWWCGWQAAEAPLYSQKAISHSQIHFHIAGGTESSYSRGVPCSSIRYILK